MAEGELIKSDDAMTAAIEVLAKLQDLTERFEICGSLRRKAVMVHDIDIVIQPTQKALEVPNIFGVQPVSEWDKRIDEMIKQAEIEYRATVKKEPDFEHGPKKIYFVYHGVPIDLYLATTETYSTLLLIKTGSARHNVILTSLAKQQKKMLHADGRGLEDLTTGKIIANSEETILMKLLGRNVPPELRN